MLLVALVGLALAAVPLAGGDLRALSRVRFRHTWLLGAALGSQLALYLWSGPPSAGRIAAHLGSFVAGIVFLLLNRRIPGLWLITFGAVLNLVALAANGGVMPASPHALAAAGLPVHPGELFSNSAALRDPNLLFLGDVFAIPASWPLSNVFSAGDVCIALGAALTIHRISGSRLAPSGEGQFAQLIRSGSFMRLWGAQVVSNLGDWVYWLAVSIALSERVQGPAYGATMSGLIIAQVGPSAVFGALFAGPLADRRSRKALMIGADVIRGIAVGSLLLADGASILHFYVVAASLGLVGSVFQPSLMASIPNVVESRQVVAANAMVASTAHIAIMVGPAVGGFLMTTYGESTAFALNASSFLLSAALILGVRIPRTRPAEPGASPLQDLVEGVRYIVSSRLVRAVILVIGLVLVAVATKNPLEPLFVREVLTEGAGVVERTRVLSMITMAWGLGMLLGAIASPALARRYHREGLLPASIVAVGVAVLAVAQTGDFASVLLAWLLAGFANTIGNVSYESLLQERTPDYVRGRVFAAAEAVFDGTYLGGAALGGLLSAWLVVSDALTVSGLVLLFAALLCVLLLPVPRRPRDVDELAARPIPARVRATPTPWPAGDPRSRVR